MAETNYVYITQSVGVFDGCSADVYRMCDGLRSNFTSTDYVIFSPATGCVCAAFGDYDISTGDMSDCTYYIIGVTSQGVSCDIQTADILDITYTGNYSYYCNANQMPEYYSERGMTYEKALLLGVCVCTLLVLIFRVFKHIS